MMWDDSSMKRRRRRRREGRKKKQRSADGEEEKNWGKSQISLSALTLLDQPRCSKGSDGHAASSIRLVAE